MKTFLVLAVLALPLHGEVRVAARAGVFAGAANAVTGTIELDARRGRWSLSPAVEVIRGGHGLHAMHVNVRHLFQPANSTVWIGAGPTWVRTNAPSSQTTWNADVGAAWRMNDAWEPFVAARYYRYRLPVSREVLEGNGAVISIGISRKLF